MCVKLLNIKDNQFKSFHKDDSFKADIWDCRLILIYTEKIYVQ